MTILLALLDGEATEFKAVVNDKVCFVVELKGCFYVRNRNGFARVAAKNIKPLTN